MRNHPYDEGNWYTTKVLAIALVFLVGIGIMMSTVSDTGCGNKSQVISKVHHLGGNNGVIIQPTSYLLETDDRGWVRTTADTYTNTEVGDTVCVPEIEVEDD